MFLLAVEPSDKVYAEPAGVFDDEDPPALVCATVDRHRHIHIVADNKNFLITVLFQDDFLSMMNIQALGRIDDSAAIKGII